MSFLDIIFTFVFYIEGFLSSISTMIYWGGHIRFPLSYTSGCSRTACRKCSVINDKVHLWWWNRT